jgi:hypothetical protein
VEALLQPIYTGPRSLVHTLVTSRRTLSPTVFTGPVLWTNPDNDLWVATSNDGFLGMVEKIGERYRSTNPLGVTIGTYDTLDLARDIIATSTADPSALSLSRSSVILTASIAAVAAVLVAVLAVWVATR